MQRLCWSLACSLHTPASGQAVFVRLPGLLPEELQEAHRDDAATFWVLRPTGGHGELHADMSGYTAAFQASMTGAASVQEECGSRLLVLLGDVLEAASGKSGVQSHTGSIKKNAKYFDSHPAIKQALSKLGMLTAVGPAANGPPSAACFAAFPF